MRIHADFAYSFPHLSPKKYVSYNVKYYICRWLTIRLLFHDPAGPRLPHQSSSSCQRRLSSDLGTWSFSIKNLKLQAANQPSLYMDGCYLSARKYYQSITNNLRYCIRSLMLLLHRRSHLCLYFSSSFSFPITGGKVVFVIDLPRRIITLRPDYWVYNNLKWLVINLPQSGYVCLDLKSHLCFHFDHLEWNLYRMMGWLTTIVLACMWTLENCFQKFQRKPGVYYMFEWMMIDLNQVDGIQILHCLSSRGSPE